MTIVRELQNPLLKLHGWLCLQGTNNTVFQAATVAPLEDKKVRFSSELKKALGIPEHVNSFYDQKRDSGAYERLWDLTVISLCSDTEAFFRSFYVEILQDDARGFGFFQRVSVTV